MANFFAILTNAGAAKLANAVALGIPLKLTEMAVGDGNGQVVTPNPAATKLVNERRRAPLNALFADPLNASQLVSEQIIPESVGGWWIRELGVYDEAGTLIAMANCPDTYKPQLSEGSGRTQVIRMVLIVSDTSAVELKIDPAVVLATRKYIDDAMTVHKDSRDHPEASEKEKGFSRFATEQEATPTSEKEASKSLAASIARVFTVLRSAAANASETTRGSLRIATKTEATDAADGDLAVPPKHLPAVIAKYSPVSGGYRALKIFTDVNSVNIAISAERLMLDSVSGDGVFLAKNVSVTAEASASGINGLDTGALAAGTWYSVWVIYNGTELSSLLSLSATSPTMPDGYTHRIRVGWIKTTATATIIPFIQCDNIIQLKNPVQIASGAQSAMVAVPAAPTSYSVRVGVSWVGNSAVACYTYVAPDNTSGYTDLNAPASIRQSSGLGSSSASISCDVIMTVPQKVYYSSNTGGSAYFYGWRDAI
ncbi:phage tail protein [Aeromonas sp. 6P]|uniref:phage tail protein n=1 Tax=Aeromonas sp. 6P TaxID=3452722 RepID=UPI003F79E1F1